MSEIVFILGAGASVHAGAPMMADFLERARDLVVDGLPEVDKIRFQRVFNAQAALQAVHSKAELDLNNIESILTTLEMARVLGAFPFEHMRDSEGVTLDGLVEDVKHLIRRTLELKMPYALREGRYQPTSDYREFVYLVKDLAKDPAQSRKCSVVTFNYDLGLDVALVFNRIAPQYHLTERPVTFPWSQGSLSVLKPHGSLNWRSRGDAPGKIEAFDLDQIVSMQYLHMRGRESAELSFAELFDEASEPVIVPPSWNKAEHHQTLSAVWRQAAKELKEARYIYVIGFSLPETDAFFRLLYALGTAGGEPLREFVVYNPDTKVKGRFQSLLGSGARGAFLFRDLPFDKAINDVRQRLGLESAFGVKAEAGGW